MTTSASDPIVGLLLAAGRSSRAQCNKLLLELDSGYPVIAQSAHHLRAAVDRLVVIVPRQDGTLAPTLVENHWENVACEQAHLGLGHSLACGIEHTPRAQGWIVALADMPWISVDTIQRVADRLRAGAGLAIPVCAGRRGHPVGFGADYREELLRLRGDQGGRRILQRDRENVVEIECADRGILLDIDREEDLARDPGTAPN
jgi:molybdenum cofactor cytidylyltransferase